jgi:hypothetical protein
VRVTSFVRYGNSTLLAVASWAATNLTVTIEIDWSTLGLDASKATVLAPALAGVQAQAKFNITATSVTLPVEAAGGWLLVVRWIHRQFARHSLQLLSGWAVYLTDWACCAVTSCVLCFGHSQQVSSYRHTTVQLSKKQKTKQKNKKQNKKQTASPLGCDFFAQNTPSNGSGLGTT